MSIFSQHKLQRNKIETTREMHQSQSTPKIQHLYKKNHQNSHIFKEWIFQVKLCEKNAHSTHSFLSKSRKTIKSTPTHNTKYSSCIKKSSKFSYFLRKWIFQVKMCEKNAHSTHSFLSKSRKTRKSSLKMQNVTSRL